MSQALCLEVADLSLEDRDCLLVCAVLALQHARGLLVACVQLVDQRVFQLLFCLESELATGFALQDALVQLDLKFVQTLDQLRILSFVKFKLER